VVEDVAMNRRVIRVMVEALGYRVATARGGQDAVDAATAFPFGLILMDCVMPHVDGYRATRTIRAFEERIGRRTPIVALTADAMHGARSACLAAGMDEYLTKPVELARLEAVLERWLPTPGPDRGAACPETSPSGVARLSRPETWPETWPETVTSPATIRTFLDELPGRLERLSEGVADRDREQVRIAAHTLRSTSLLVGAANLASACTLLEERCDAGPCDELRELVAVLVSESRTTVETLRHRLGTLDR
jgi:CheY-like chemotaxis protein